jgi:hypothetical protein
VEDYVYAHKKLDGAGLGRYHHSASPVSCRRVYATTGRFGWRGNAKSIYAD